MSIAERDIYGDLKFKLVTQGKKFEKQELKNIIKWAFKSFPDTAAPNVITSAFWDLVDIKLYNSATKRNSYTQKLLPIFQLISV